MTDRDESRAKNLHAPIPFDRPRSVIDNRRSQVLTDLRLSLEIGGRKFTDLKSEQATIFLADGALLVSITRVVGIKRPAGWLARAVLSPPAKLF